MKYMHKLLMLIICILFTNVVLATIAAPFNIYPGRHLYLIASSCPLDTTTKTHYTVDPVTPYGDKIVNIEEVSYDPNTGAASVYITANAYTSMQWQTDDDGCQLEPNPARPAY